MELSKRGKVVGVCLGVAGFAAYNLYRFGHFQSAKNTLLGLTDDCNISGTVSPGFEKVKEVFEENFRYARELGSQFCVYYKGKKVVDLAGVGEKSQDKAYNADSLQVVFSSSKVITAIVVAWLVDKGHLDYAEKISTYWPEFAQNGKENITLAELMRHESGLDCYRIPLSEELAFGDGKDPRIAEIIESTTPVWSPESKRCYHGLLRGTTINEIVKRTDPRGRTVGEILNQEICSHTGADCYFGLPEKHEPRVSSMVMEGGVGAFKSSIPLLLGIGPEKDCFKYLSPGSFGFERWVSKSTTYKEKPGEGPVGSNTRMYRAGHLPSASGVTNARSMGRIGDWFIREGVRSETLQKALNVSTPRMLDVGVGIHSVFVDGGFCEDLLEEELKFKGYYGWGGYGGSLLFFNPEKELVVAFAMTGMVGTLLRSHRSVALWQQVEEAIAQLEQGQ